MKITDDKIIAFAEVNSDAATAGDRNGIVLYRRGDEYVFHSFYRDLPEGDLVLFWGHYYGGDLVGAIKFYMDKRSSLVQFGIADELRIDDTGA